MTVTFQVFHIFACRTKNKEHFLYLLLQDSNCIAQQKKKKERTAFFYLGTTFIPLLIYPT